MKFQSTLFAAILVPLLGTLDAITAQETSRVNPKSPGDAVCNTQRVIQNIIEADPNTLKGMNGEALDDASSRNFAKIQSFYRSCMDESQHNAVDAKPLYEDVGKLVRDIFPVPGSILTRVFSDGAQSNDDTTMTSAKSIDRKALTSALAHFALTSPGALVSIFVGVDVTEPKIQTVEVSEAGLTWGDLQVYQDARTMQSFQEQVQQVFSLVLGDKASNAIKLQLAKETVSFETKLASIATSRKDIQDDMKRTNPMGLNQLVQLNGAVDWPQLLAETLGPNNPYAGQSRKNLTVTSPLYQEKLAKLLSQTSPETLQAFFAWKVIWERKDSLPKSFREPLEEITSLVMDMSAKNANQNSNRKDNCVYLTNKHMGPLVGYFYVAQTFTDQDKAALVEIIDSLKKAYLVSIPDMTWLDNQTRTNAIEKLQAISPLIGYSAANPNVGDPRSLEEYFSEFEVIESNFYATMDQARRFPIRKNFDLIYQPTIRERMDDDPQTINAFYSPYTNQIIFPAAFFQKPMYVPGVPEYLTYAGIGVIAGHEITHGFDSTGRHYDGTGKLRNWWTEETSSMFVSKSKCFIDQYSNFTIQDPKTRKTLNVDGELTLGENIADHGGIKRAFEAWYQRFKSTSQTDVSKNQILPGLEKYTRDQMFFVSYAQLWCGKMTFELEEHLLKSDTHAPGRWRVNGPAQNIPAFSQAFKCKQGSPMNPANKCSIW
ncbi:hypothetical protein BGW41_007179 [Actinomortierella wolfii]|nr:hypothetical protein BGW41_007179 [Actinomortierella wolfii]